MAAVVKKAVVLSNGVVMPSIGGLFSPSFSVFVSFSSVHSLSFFSAVGTWQLGSGNAQRVIREAIQAGYRLIDTASGYHNEEAIGVALNDAMQSGKVKREELFVTTKLSLLVCSFIFKL